MNADGSGKSKSVELVNNQDQDLAFCSIAVKKFKVCVRLMRNGTRLCVYRHAGVLSGKLEQAGGEYAMAIGLATNCVR